MSESCAVACVTQLPIVKIESSLFGRVKQCYQLRLTGCNRSSLVLSVVRVVRASCSQDMMGVGVAKHPFVYDLGVS